MKNKKTTMAASAFFILFFHLWIPLTTSSVERYLRELCVVGVDLFFFVSAYSVSKIKDEEYKSFLKNRFSNIYVKFFLFALIAAIYLSWDISKILKTILGMELFVRGGGSFLWFLPGIMLVYILLPLYKKWDIRYPKIVPIVTILLQLLVSIMMSIFTSNQAILILINRIPVILLGYYFEKYHILEQLRKKQSSYALVTTITLIVGIIISYYTYQTHLQVTWFKDLFYILYIPLIIGLILLLDQIKENKFSIFISSLTLELYGLQMIFGFRIANAIFSITNNKLITNLLVILVLIGISWGAKELFQKIKNRTQKKKENERMNLASVK